MSAKESNAHIDVGMDMACITDFHFRTPLHMASFRGDCDTVGKLLDEGAKPNDKEALLGLTSLHYACYGFADEKCVGLLLERKALVGVLDYNGRSPLHYAANGGRVAVVKLLLAEMVKSFHADHLKDAVSKSDTFGITALHACCMSGCSTTKLEGRVEVAAELIKAGADKNTIQMQAAVEIARAHGFDALAKLLTE